MNPGSTKAELYVEPLMTPEQRAKTKNAGLNRASARQMHRDLARTLAGLVGTDERVKRLRVERKRKRREAAKVKNKNRSRK